MFAKKPKLVECGIASILSEDEACRLDATLQTLGYTSLRAKVDITHRVARALLARQQVLAGVCGPFPSTPFSGEVLHSIAKFDSETAGVCRWQESHKNSLGDVASTHPLFVEVIAWERFTATVIDWGSAAMAFLKREVDRQCNQLLQDVDISCPTETTLTSKQILVDDALRKAVLDNPHKAALTANVVLLNMFREAAKPILDQAISQNALAMIKRGKLAIGVEFALKKLDLIREAATPADRVSIARGALDKVKSKNLSLPKMIKAALTKCCE